MATAGFTVCILHARARAGVLLKVGYASSGCAAPGLPSSPHPWPELLRGCWAGQGTSIICAGTVLAELQQPVWTGWSRLGSATAEVGYGWCQAPVGGAAQQLRPLASVPGPRRNNAVPAGGLGPVEACM